MLRRCVVCRKFSGPPYSTVPPLNLPDIRVSEDPPFTQVGVDLQVCEVWS